MVNFRAFGIFAALLFGRCDYVVAAISSSMIVEMREITSVAASPDGTKAVIGVIHANPVTNQTEVYWVIVQLRGAGKPTVIPAGQEIFDPRTPGVRLNQGAQWSKDGKLFFYLRRKRAEVQLWSTRSNGQMTHQVTHSGSDLIGLALGRDRNELNIELAPDREKLRDAERKEDRDGILYDDHILGGNPLTETLPVIDRWRNLRRAESGNWEVPGWTGISNAAFDIRSGTLTLRVKAVTDKSEDSGSDNTRYRATVVALSQVPANTPAYYPGQFTLQLESKIAITPSIKCGIAECIANQITVLGWSPDDSEIYYVADSAQGRRGTRFPGHAAIYAWNPASNVVRLIYDANGRLYNLAAPMGLALTSVPIINQEIVVAVSGADEPPQLESINLATGASRVIYDPNSQLRKLTRGRAVWHNWPTSSIYPGRGIIILPDDYRPGKTYPAVITTYTCGNGFLRGGGADNVPEFVAAHQGFVAVCIDFTVREIMARETDFSKLYPTMCDIMAGLIANQIGIIDPNRVGLSGQSLGSDAGTYCISHSGKFAAAAFRHGSPLERARWDLFDTAASRRDPINGAYAKFNMPDPRNDPDGRWDEMSIARKAKSINTPLLIQTDDSEYLISLPLWSAMHEEGKPIEMYVFPKESHVLIQPVHRLVNYERQLDWFRFWLMHEEDPSSSKKEQYTRWSRLRDALPEGLQH